LENSTVENLRSSLLSSRAHVPHQHQSTNQLHQQKIQLTTRLHQQSKLANEDWITGSQKVTSSVFVFQLAFGLYDTTQRMA
jgi:photosystem II stability/assembly factor-like uncharacterized protein